MSCLLVSLALFAFSDESAAPPVRGGIAWFGTWEQAEAEAARTQRPILLVSAAPACHGVPGIW